MGTDSIDRAAVREQLSALADGELVDTQVAAACAQWRGDAELRASWHAYQLIGDVLRSDDLGSESGHDAGFLALLRSRLADEPVVFAPQAAVAAAASIAAGAVPAAPAAVPRFAGYRAWRTPAAVAAGFVAVVGVVVAMRFTAPEAPVLARSAVDPALVAASTTGAGAVGAVPAVASPTVDARGLVASGKLIRDVRLDRYLSAHKEFAGSSALGVPSGFLRNATADAADR